MSSDDLDLDDRLGGDHRSSPRRPVVAAADPACNLLAGSLIATERICKGPNTSRSSLCAQCAVCSLVVPVRSQFSRLAVAMSVSRDRDWVGNPSARTMKKYTDQGILLERIGPVAGPRTRWRVLCARCYECGRRRPFSTPHKALAHVRTACWYSAPPEGVLCVCTPSACLPFCASWTAAPAGSVVPSWRVHFQPCWVGSEASACCCVILCSSVIEEGRFDAYNCVADDMDHSCSCAGQRTPTPPPRDAAARCGPPITQRELGIHAEPSDSQASAHHCRCSCDRGQLSSPHPGECGGGEGSAQARRGGHVPTAVPVGAARRRLSRVLRCLATVTNKHSFCSRRWQRWPQRTSLVRWPHQRP
jgi:hypothetical protein